MIFLPKFKSGSFPILGTILTTTPSTSGRQEEGKTIGYSKLNPSSTKQNKKQVETVLAFGFHIL
jgi:hypothetical protein